MAVANGVGLGLLVASVMFYLVASAVLDCIRAKVLLEERWGRQVAEFVRAAEQIHGAGSGSLKRQYVILRMGQTGHYGNDVEPYSMRDAMEAEVYKLRGDTDGR